MRRSLRGVLFAAPFVLLVGGGAASGAGLGAAPAAPGVVTNAVALQSAPTHVWTQAERDAAIPMDIQVTGTATAPATAAPAVTGTPGVVAGSPGDPADPAAVDAVVGVSVGLQAGGFDYPTPFTRYEVEKTLRYTAPYKAMGKLFFTQNGTNYVCSASAISATEIWTAGHCVSDGHGHWSTNVVFYPNYRDGAAGKYGTFSCPTLYTTTSWHASADLTYDFAKAACGLNAAGKNFKATTGYLGFAWNLPYQQHLDAFGFPQAAPFNGNRLDKCESSFGHTDTRLGTSPAPRAIGCDMTGGSSGGPWLVNLGSGNYVNGENSYKYTSPSEPLEMYSPYYGDLANAVRTA